MENMIGGVSLPFVTAQRGEPKVIGGRYIDTWRLTVSRMTGSQFDLLENVARNALVQQVRRAVDGTPHAVGGASVTFRLKEWPENVVKQVYILRFSHDRTPFQGPNGWEPRGRTVEMELEEA